jgi:CRISPR-associated protein Cmr3
MRVFIEASDVWLFRDGRPFRAGEDHWAHSLFPPTPLTMQGVARSKVLLDSGVSVEAYRRQASEAQTLIEQIGWGGNDFGRLSLRGPYIAHRTEKDGAKCLMRYYPLPADVVRLESGEAAILAPLGDDVPFTANWPSDAPCLHPLWCVTREALKGPDGRWLDETAMQDYLAGDLPQRFTIDEELFVREPRPGIRRERDTGTTEQGYLYEVGFIRPKPGVGLEVAVGGIPTWQPEKGVLGIGGEARAGYYELWSERKPTFPVYLKERFKIYFATPALFEQGWRPDDWNRFFIGGTVRLIAAAVGRLQPIGGWDVVRRKPKPIRAAIPAGSVYYFEAEGVVTYDGRPVSDYDGRIGFGQILAGRWDYV